MITGIALISKDGFIADGEQSMARIAHDYDFMRLQEILDTFPEAVSVVGRVTHEKHGNPRGRTRYVLSATVKNEKARPWENFFANERDLITAVTKNPDEQTFVLGGSYLYTLFGGNKLYDEFYLTERRDVALNTGIPLDLHHEFTDVARQMGLWGLKQSEDVSSPLFPYLKVHHFKR